MQRLMPRSRRAVGEVAEVVDVAEVGPHRAVVGHRVAAVVGRRPRRQQRHQVQVRHPEVHEVVDVVGHAGRGCRRTGRRTPRSRARRAAGTSRLGQPLVVEVVQLVGPRVVRRPGDRQQPVRDRLGVVVQPPERGHQVGTPPLDAGLEDLSAGQGVAAHGRQYVASSACAQASGQETSVSRRAGSWSTSAGPTTYDSHGAPPAERPDSVSHASMAW